MVVVEQVVQVLQVEVAVAKLQQQQDPQLVDVVQGYRQQESPLRHHHPLLGFEEEAHLKVHDAASLQKVLCVTSHPSTVGLLEPDQAAPHSAAHNVLPAAHLHLQNEVVRQWPKSQTAHTSASRSVVAKFNSNDPSRPKPLVVALVIARLLCLEEVHVSSNWVWSSGRSRLMQKSSSNSGICVHTDLCDPCALSDVERFGHG